MSLLLIRVKMHLCLCDCCFLIHFGKLTATVWSRDLVQEEEQLMEEKKKKKDDKKKKEAAQKKVVYV